MLLEPMYSQYIVSILFAELLGNMYTVYFLFQFCKMQQHHYDFLIVDREIFVVSRSGSNI